MSFWEQNLFSWLHLTSGAQGSSSVVPAGALSSPWLLSVAFSLCLMRFAISQTAWLQVLETKQRFNSKCTLHEALIFTGTCYWENNNCPFCFETGSSFVETMADLIQVFRVLWVQVCFSYCDVMDSLFFDSAVAFIPILQGRFLLCYT